MEYIVYLSVKEYDKILGDLVNFGFVLLELVNDSVSRLIVVFVFAEMLEMFYGIGGGIIVKIDVFNV